MSRNYDLEIPWNSNYEKGFRDGRLKASEEITSLKSKIDFYQQATDSVRQLLFGDSGHNEPIYDAIILKFLSNEEDIKRLKKLVEAIYWEQGDRDDYGQQKQWEQFKKVHNL